MPIKNMVISALLLSLFAVIGAAMVGATYEGTKARIAQNEKEALMRTLRTVIDPGSYDNDVYADVIEVTAPMLLGTKAPVDVYRARHAGAPVAAVIATVAPDGYGGPIRLLVAIRYNGTISGVRVLSENETPGLGDNIEMDRTHWILGFDNRSLGNPDAEHWKVKKDGGVFDQFTGATITPRAVVKAVYNSLRYFRDHREALFAPAKEAHHG